jgi:hypothetical protein
MIAASNIRATWRNNPEDNYLHTRHHDNLKSHPVTLPFASNFID